MEVKALIEGWAVLEPYEAVFLLLSNDFHNLRDGPGINLAKTV